MIDFKKASEAYSVFSLMNNYDLSETDRCEDDSIDEFYILIPANNIITTAG
jgi:hypothetical protein